MSFHGDGDPVDGLDLFSFASSLGHHTQPVTNMGINGTNTTTAITDKMVNTDYYSDFAYFSHGQTLILFLVANCSFVLSIFGSVLILYLVLHGKRYREGLYHRLLLGLSISDLVLTFSLMLQPFLTPEATGYPFARGNATTCAVVGFGYLYFVASYTYNCLLGVYFLLTVRYDVTQRKIAKYLEPYGHILAFCVPTAIGISATLFDLLNANPFLGICSLAPVNHECDWMEGSNAVCENQTQYKILNAALDYYALAMAAIGLVCTIAVYATVRTRYGHRRPKGKSSPNDHEAAGGPETTIIASVKLSSSSLHLSNTGSDDESDDDDDHEKDPGIVQESSNAALEREQQLAAEEAQDMRIQQIAMQAVWYAVAYMVGLLVVVAANIVDTIYLDANAATSDLSRLGAEPLYFVMILLIWLLFPLQGFFNGMIYIRPRLVRWKHHYEDASWWFAFRMVLRNEPPPKWGEAKVSRSKDNSNSMGKVTKVSPNTSNNKKSGKGSNSKNTGSGSSGGRQQGTGSDGKLYRIAYAMKLDDDTDEDGSNNTKNLSTDYWKHFKGGKKPKTKSSGNKSVSWGNNSIGDYVDGEHEIIDNYNRKQESSQGFLRNAAGISSMSSLSSASSHVAPPAMAPSCSSKDRPPRMPFSSSKKDLPPRMPASRSSRYSDEMWATPVRHSGISNKKSSDWGGLSIGNYVDEDN